MSGQCCSKLLGRADEKRRMRILEGQYRGHVRAGVQIQRNVQIRKRLPENIILRLVVIQGCN